VIPADPEADYKQHAALRREKALTLAFYVEVVRVVTSVFWRVVCPGATGGLLAPLRPLVWIVARRFEKTFSVRSQLQVLLEFYELG
jgi:hypothetical protein